MLAHHRLQRRDGARADGLSEYLAVHDVPRPVIFQGKDGEGRARRDPHAAPRDEPGVVGGDLPTQVLVDDGPEAPVLR